MDSNGITDLLGSVYACFFRRPEDILASMMLMVLGVQNKNAMTLDRARVAFNGFDSRLAQPDFIFSVECLQCVITSATQTK